jgi:branched-chain amino acid transport system permease protein
MEQVLLFSVLGLGTGALTAGLAVSLVTVYRGGGVINLAAGAIAMTTGYAFWWFRGGTQVITGDKYGAGLSTPIALILTIIAAAALGVFCEIVVFRPLHDAPPLAKLIGSLGILLLLQSAVQLAFGNAPQSEPLILPTINLRMLGGSVPVVNFILCAVVIVISAALAAFYRWTRFGLATRAAAENEASAMLAGLAPRRLSMANTLIGTLLAGALGVLAAPLISLDSQNLPLIVVPALGAALLARFTSIPVACVAGMAIGCAESVVVYLSTLPWFPQDSGAPLPGVADLLVFLVIVVALMWRGTSLPGRGDILERRLPIVPRPERLLAPAVVSAILGAAALVALPYDFRQAFMNTLIGTILALSLVVTTGFVGQISLMQLALSGVAGFVVSHLAVGAGIGFPLGILIGALAATLLGLAIAVTALRIRGVLLAVVTLSGAVALQNFGFNNNTWVGGQTGAPVPQPSLFGIDLGSSNKFRGIDGHLPSPVLGFLILIVTILLCLLVASIRRSNLGNRMLAVRSNERASAAVGINVRSIKLIAFGISSFIAGIAGGLYGYDFGSVSTNRFSAIGALTLIAFAYVGGITMVSGAVIAGVLAVQGLSQYSFEKWFGITGTWTVFMASVAVIGNVIFAPSGTSGMMYLSKQKRRRRRQEQAAAREGRQAEGLRSAPTGVLTPGSSRATTVDERLDLRATVSIGEMGEDHV